MTEPRPTYDFDAEFEAMPSASASLPANADEAGGQDKPKQPRIGRTVNAHTSHGITVILDRDVDIETLDIGTYVVVQGSTGDFFCIVEDTEAEAERTHLPRGDISERTLQRRLGVTMWSQLHCRPYLHRPAGGVFGPVRRVPRHISPVRQATQAEVDAVFGGEGNGNFHVGEPLDMENVKITLNLERLIERSTGVFGATGTGKTFLARIILAGIIQQRSAVSLIFDMHNEYGWESGAEHAYRVKGLKQLFPAGQVNIFTLDPESSRRRGSNPDHTVTIGYDQVEPEDLEMLQSVMDLSEAQVGAIYALRRRLGTGWLANFMDDAWVDDFQSADPEGSNGLKGLADSISQPYQTLAALRRRLNRFRKYGFLTERSADDTVRRILQYLQAGTSIVLEFGRYGNMLDAYIFAANFLTRRLHEMYVQHKEQAFGDRTQEPTPLVIVIEEAHKFLDPAIAKHTIFGTIARELRKYNVTLFIIDQRPSAIDPEVMSQIGTRVTALLTEENDIRAVLMGVSGAEGLKEVLARLDTRQQAMILGHAVPMPVVVRTRNYDQDFYRAMGWLPPENRRQALEATVALMRGDADFEGFD